MVMEGQDDVTEAAGIYVTIELSIGESVKSLLGQDLNLLFWARRDGWIIYMRARPLAEGQAARAFLSEV
jgi:hypothetical protein